MRISANMLTTATSCEQKFYHRYVAKTPEDSNYEKPKALQFGSALHKLLELSGYKEAGLMLQKDSVQEEYKLSDTEIAKALVCAKEVVYKIRNIYRPTFIFPEVSFTSDDNLYGIIDAILVFENGNFHLFDVKSCSSFCKNKPAILTQNLQVGFYLKNLDAICKKAELDISKFKGFVYLEVLKPTQRIKKNELIEDFSRRLTSDIRAIEIKETNVNVEPYISKVQSLAFQDYYTKNLSNCIMFNSPCEYFASCHGQPYIKNEVENE